MLRAVLTYSEVSLNEVQTLNASAVKAMNNINNRKKW